jgi:hypothetical protein
VPPIKYCGIRPVMGLNLVCTSAIRVWTASTACIQYMSPLALA